MGKKTSNLLKVLAVVSLLCLGMASAAKADTLSGFTNVSGTGISFTGVIVWVDGYNAGGAAQDPFTSFIPAFEPSTNPNPFNSCVGCGTSDGFASFLNATVVFGGANSGVTGPGGMSLAALGGVNDNGVNAFATGTSFYTLGGGGTTANMGTPVNFQAYTGGANTDCQNANCNPNDTVVLKQFGAQTFGGNTYDIFSITDISIGYVFAIPEAATTTTTTIPSTPEPSSLLMLGSGLLGLFGLGLRRKSEV